MKFAIIKTTVGDRDRFQRTLARHRAYLDDLRARGVLLTSGLFDDRSGGMLLVEAADFEEAIAIARQDPLVSGGLDRYLIKEWLATAGPDAGDADGQEAIRRVDTSPIAVTDPADETFRIVDASEHPEGERYLSCCLVPGRCSESDPVRAGYLRLARDRGLRKLLLVHEGQVVGQAETAPPEVSGFPVSGEGVAFVHCVWVQEAFTGLEGGRALLAACAAQEGVRSLATVAYNDALPWMPASFFTRQGFARLDQVETGRFFEDTPIVAYLLWRPVEEDAPRPTWDRQRFLEGVDFCPKYPWMAGKMLYWGETYAYHAVLVREGLRRPELLRRLPILGSRRSRNWTLVRVGLPEADLSGALERIQSTLIDEPTYFAHIYPASGEGRVLVVFPDRVFSVTTDPASWEEARRYGVDKGIPESELKFGPLET